MGLNLSERLVPLLNVILVVALAYFAALSFNDVVARRLSEGLTGGAPSAPVARASAPALLRSAYDAIARRDIFNLPHETVAQPITADLHLRLLGTSELTRGKSFAILEDSRTLKQSLYQLGDDIPDAGKLAAIEKSRVLIDHGGQTVSIEIPQVSQPSPASASGLFQQPEATRYSNTGQPGVQQMAPNQYVLDRSVVDNNLQNLGGLLTQARAIPNIEGGQPRGFKLSEVQPGSIFQQLGLQNGDVVSRVQGQDINDPARAMSLFQQLRSQPSISIEVMRGGVPVTLNYQVR